MEFTEVVEAWSAADVEAIHPLRAIDQQAYWESGQAQAEQAAAWVPAGGTIVDFGCGEGRLSIPLSQMGLEVVAVDSSIEMLQRLRRNMKDRDGHRIAAILNSHGLNLESVLSNAGIEQVDAIVARAVLIHHNYEGVSALVHSFAQVLQPGGYLIADWPVGRPHERRDWIDVTTWEPGHRERVALNWGFDLVEDSTPGVWVKQ